MPGGGDQREDKGVGFTEGPGLEPASPIAIKDRMSFATVGRCRLDVLDGAFVAVGEDEVRRQIPIGNITTILLEPGTRITHEAVKLAARTGTLLIWCGEGGVRLYAAGQPGGARSERLLHQARLALDDGLRLQVVRKMYTLRFGEDPPSRRSIDQLRGLEAARVKRRYQTLAQEAGITWKRRNYDPKTGKAGDLPNLCLSAATASLYGLCEAAILAAGYAPAIGFLHTGKARSFVFDIADIVKFDTVVPAAFKVAARKPENPERETRIACRDIFRDRRLLKRLVPLVEDVLTIEGAPPPPLQDEAQPVAFDDPENEGDAGHRG
jgi:CRISPR-associated protein Cas1